MSFPCQRITPLSGDNRPHSMRRRLVFPLPFSPATGEATMSETGYRIIASLNLLHNPMFEPVGHPKFIHCAPLWATVSRRNQGRSPPATSPPTPAATETVGHEQTAESCRPWQSSYKYIGVTY